MMPLTMNFFMLSPFDFTLNPILGNFHRRARKGNHKKWRGGFQDSTLET
jgi:hypothetical protein